MDDVIMENLEDYLSGTLTAEQRERFEAYLAMHPEVAGMVAAFQENAGLLHGLRPGPAADLEPDAGFYARVMNRVERERAVPFWTMFLQPPLVRRVAFAGLMWLFILGVYTVTYNGSSAEIHYAERILTTQTSPDYRVRLGSDLDQNRRSMMAVLMTSGD